MEGGGHFYARSLSRPDRHIAPRFGSLIPVPSGGCILLPIVHRTTAGRRRSAGVDEAGGEMVASPRVQPSGRGAAVPAVKLTEPHLSPDNTPYICPPA